MNYKRLIIFISLVYFCNPLITYACRYTIREIGYSDIGASTYELYIFTNSETSEEELSTIKKLSQALLNETNVLLKLVDVDKEKSEQVADMLSGNVIPSFPSAVFVFPGGDHMIFSLDHPKRSLNESVWLLLEDLFNSAFRRSIKEELTQAYSVVLVVEGENKLHNRSVLFEVKQAVREITMTLDQMPKVVDSPPVILVLPRKNMEDERLLLMSLGITGGETKSPSVAILYGRGRIMGPVLQGNMISRDKILNLLTVVGADCECGLDQSWILGRMIPMRWETSVQSDVTRNLGFDVENPMVKSEMSQILSMKPTPDHILDPVGSKLLGYSEGKLEIKGGPENVSKVSAAEVRNSFFQAKPSKKNLVFNTILIGLGAILLMVLVLLLFIQHKRRKMLR